MWALQYQYDIINSSNTTRAKVEKACTWYTGKLLTRAKILLIRVQASTAVVMHQVCPRMTKITDGAKATTRTQRTPGIDTTFVCTQSVVCLEIRFDHRSSDVHARIHSTSALEPREGKRVNLI